MNDVDAPFVAEGGEGVNDVVLVEIFVACEEVSKGIRDGSGCEEHIWFDERTGGQRVGKGISWLDVRFRGISSLRYAANGMRSANQDASGHHFARCKSPCAEVSVAASLRIVVQRRTNHAKRGVAEQSPQCARAVRPTRGWKRQRESHTSRSDDVDEPSHHAAKRTYMYSIRTELRKIAPLLVSLIWVRMQPDPRCQGYLLARIAGLCWFHSEVKRNLKIDDARSGL